jgi:hypothetical protein
MRDSPAVLAHALDEIARRLGVDATRLSLCKFDDLVRIADPELPPEYRYASRSNRAYPRRFR